MNENGPWKILVVEDNALFRWVFKSSLSSLQGVEVIEAEDLAAGRAKLREHRPDMAFVDISLPDGNGLDLLETLRQELPTCVSGICSTHDTQEYRDVARDRGASFFLPKHQLDWGAVTRHIDEARIGKRG